MKKIKQKIREERQIMRLRWMVALITVLFWGGVIYLLSFLINYPEK